jgi:NADH-quinone oxidoreductase subunit G
MPIADMQTRKRVLVIGSFLRKDHPLAAHRLRQAARKGAEVSLLHPVADDSHIKLAHSYITPPSKLPLALAEIVVAAARAASKPAPDALAGIEPSAVATAIAASLASGDNKAILLGNLAEQHAEASQLLALAHALGEIVGATVGCLTEAANSVGGYAAGALPHGSSGMNARAMIADPRKAYLVLGVEPEFDCANPVATRNALEKAEFVVVMSPFHYGAPYADVLLPVAPFTETAGTFVNCEGRVQSFAGSVQPLGETRPAWKVLRVLGTMLGLPGFDFESIADVRAWLPSETDIAARLSNATQVAVAKPSVVANGLERVADVPILFADPLVRRAPALQLTIDAKPPKARMNALTLAQIGAAEGALVKVTQGRGEAVLATLADATVPAGVVRIAAAHPSTCGLDGLTGPVTVERA